METWRLLAGVSVLLVVWAGVVLALGRQPGLSGLVVVVVASVIGLFLGEAVSERLDLAGDDD